MIKLAAEHAVQRKQFKTRIADFEIIKNKIAKMTANTYALESMVYLTAALVDRYMPDYSLEGACCKVFGTEILWDNINEALQISGGNGFMNEYPYGRGLRDSRVNMIFEGTNEILRLYIALAGLKEVGAELKGVQSALKDPLSQFGLLTDFAQKRLIGQITNPIFTKVHPLLSTEAATLGKYVTAIANAMRIIVWKHGQKVVDKQYQLERIGNVMIDIYAQIATLSRVTKAIETKGDEKVRGEVNIARFFCHQSRRRIISNIKSLEKNKDVEASAIANEVYEFGGYPFDLWN
jgi:acyl-CoA dehydrogenase family protein 9